MRSRQAENGQGILQYRGKCPGDKGELCSQNNVFPVLAKPQVAKGKILEGTKWKCLPTNPQIPCAFSQNKIVRVKPQNKLFFEVAQLGRLGACAPNEAPVLSARAPPPSYHKWPACYTLLFTEKHPSNCRSHELHLPVTLSGSMGQPSPYMINLMNIQWERQASTMKTWGISAQ